MSELRQSTPWWRRSERVGVMGICSAILAVALPWPWWLIVAATLGAGSALVFGVLDERAEQRERDDE